MKMGDSRFVSGSVRSRVVARSHAGIWLAAGLSAIVPLGCGSGPSKAVPLSAINDRNAHTGTQISAIRRSWDAVRAGEADAAEVRESLKRAAWARSSWVQVRLAAIEVLLEDQASEADTRNMLRLMLPTETQWPVIEFVSKTAGERGWTDLTASLVRCWSRRVAEPPDEARPERAALAALYPDRAVEDIVFGVFAGSIDPGGGRPLRDRDRQDAWALLRRIDQSGARTVAMLSGPARADEDEVIQNLRAAARDLHALPETAEQLAWLERLRRPQHASFWRECAGAISRLDDEQKKGLELRHAPGVRWAALNQPSWLARPRDELISELSGALKPRKKFQRASGGAGAAGGAGESIDTWRSGLAWGDALLFLIALQAVDDSALAGLVFQQAEEDRRDVSTEHGGVIESPNPGAFGVRTFAPRPTQRFGDRRFVASQDMLDAGTTALFHYHLHAQRYDNAEFAGPSPDDIDYARLQGRTCIVFSFISRDLMDADAYQPSGAVLDLGAVRRPSTP